MAQHAVCITEKVLKFDAILSGVLGARDAVAAKQWLDAGAQIEAPDPTLDWVYKDPHPQGFDTRILKGAGRGSFYESESEQEPSRSPSPMPARPPRPPSGKRPASRLSNPNDVSKAAAPASKFKRKRSPQPAENVYGRSAFVTHKEVGNILRGRIKRRSGSPQPQNMLKSISREQEEEAATIEELPRGWTEYRIISSSAKPGSGMEKEVETTSYVSPEGVCCSTWDIAQGVEVARRHPGPSAAKLVDWVRAAARTSVSMLPLQVAGGVARQMVGLQRIRLLQNPHEKKCSEQRKRQNKKIVTTPAGWKKKDAKKKEASLKLNTEKETPPSKGGKKQK